MNNTKINKDDNVRVVKANDEFTNFMDIDIGDEFTVEKVDNERNVLLVNQKKRLSFPTELLDKYFEKVEDDVFYDIDDEDFDYIAEILSKSEFKVVTNVFDKCTIVACRLPNGFVIVESSSCTDPDDYDLDIGVENCMNRIRDKVIELEAYVCHEELSEDCECEECCDNCHCSDCVCDDGCI